MIYGQVGGSQRGRRDERHGGVKSTEVNVTETGKLKRGAKIHKD